MKTNRLATILFSVIGLFLAGLAQGQTTTPAAPVQHFVISANAAGYNGTSQAVSIAGAGFQLTSNVSLAYTRVSNPADTTQPIYNLGDVSYTRELGSILGKKLTSKLAFDTTNWLVTFSAGGGKVTAPGINRVAEDFGVYVSRPVADHLQMTTGYRVLHGIGTSVVKVPSIGMNVTF